MSDGYGEDLAYIHDVGFGDFAREAAPWLLRLLHERGIDSGHVVDLGCGSGLWARDLGDAGYKVTGFDISPSMLTLARRRAPNATFSRKSFLRAKLPSCDAVTAIGEVFCYCFDDHVQASSLDSLFSRIHRALRPGGLLVFDVATPGRAGPNDKRFRHWAEQDWALLLRTEEDKESRELTRTMTIFRKTGLLYRRDEETHRLRLYPPQEIAAKLRRAGFHVRTIRSYGETKFPHGLVGFAASKAA